MARFFSSFDSTVICIDPAVKCVVTLITMYRCRANYQQNRTVESQYHIVIQYTVMSLYNHVVYREAWCVGGDEAFSAE